jgi:hypothetical protein
MSDIYVRRQVEAKTRPFRLDTSKETQLVEITSTATAGTFSTAGNSLGALLLKVNGTSVKIPFYTA